MAVDFDYSNLTEITTVIYRVTCFAMRDPDHPIPTRFHLTLDHVGKHQSRDFSPWNIVEEWVDEDSR